MAKYQTFEEVPVWQQASRLYNCVLDLLKEPNAPLTAGFRNQLDRAALSVSNNIAEGFDRMTTNELLSFLSIARGSSGEVRSMVAVVKNRPELKGYANHLAEVRTLAESCCRQLGAWMSSIEDSSVKGKRHMTAQARETKRSADAARDFRLKLLRSLKSDHPLFNSPDARAARGEAESNS